MLANYAAVHLRRRAANYPIVSGLGDQRKVAPGSAFLRDQETIIVRNFYLGTTIVTFCWFVPPRRFCPMMTMVC